MILLFSDDVRFGCDMAKRLRKIGLPAVSHDPNFACQICERVDFCSVILDGRRQPHVFEMLSEQLFQHYPDLPILFLAPPSDQVFPCAAQVVRAENANRLWDDMKAFCRRCMGQENYSTYALQHRAETKQFIYLGYPLPLSDYEYRFLLCLFRNAPNATKTDILLSEAFPNAGTPKTTLWSLAKRINQASGAISGLRLIQSSYGIGYRLSDGIVGHKKGAYFDTKTETRATLKN